MRGIATPPNDGDILQAKGGFFQSVSSAVFAASLTIAGVAYLAVANIFTQPQTISPATIAVNTLLFLQSSIANFLQVDIQNTSNGQGAQSGFSATADTGTATTFFNWLGINNSGPALVAQFNIGASLDSSLLSSSRHLYIANTIPAYDMIHCTGSGSASSLMPWYIERMRLSNSNGITVTGQLNHEPVGQVPGGMIGVLGFRQFAAPSRFSNTYPQSLYSN